LVVNSGIEPENVVEVDITTGLLVRELVTGVDGVTNVAATATMFAVSNFGATLSSLSQVKIYDVNGTLLASFGGTRLSDGETDYVGE
jgi:predicted signal transduction protein with EAL and GGDEF domain